jgi:23S rRNA pseudouridine1911/1915/1917 synthase
LAEAGGGEPRPYKPEGPDTRPESPANNGRVMLAETAEFLALDKPAGVSMATSKRRSAGESIAALLDACGERRTEELWLVHRLDVGTSGVVLLAKTADAHRALSLAFQSSGVRKTYRALVWGHPRPAAGVIEEPLGRDPKDGRRMKARAGGKRAVTRYRTLRRFPSVADLELTPETGRTHQIRVHLSGRGHPIVGDDLYGGATRWRGVRAPAHRRALAAAARPLLHAERLEVPQMKLDVRAPLPEDYTNVVAALATSPSPTGRGSL